MNDTLVRQKGEIMSEKRSITYDHCGTELVVDSKYPHYYGLHLSAKDYGINSTEMYYAISMPPPLDSAKDFCGKKCLMAWLAISGHAD